MLMNADTQIIAANTQHAPTWWGHLIALAMTVFLETGLFVKVLSEKIPQKQ